MENNLQEIREKYPEVPLGKGKDLRGQKFGRLIPLYRCHDKSDSAYWLCQCDCGKYTRVRAGHLLQGKIISCGCWLKDHPAGKGVKREPNHEDLAGQKFGMMTCLYYVRKDKANHAIWRCRCDCGREKDVPATHLKTGHNYSCGCLKESQYEKKVASWLELHGIKFKREITIPELGRLRFDFQIFIEDFYLFLEVQGQQHFRPSSFFGGEEAFNRLKENDAKKTKFCKEKGIELFTVNYFDNIEEVLAKRFNDYSERK